MVANVDFTDDFKGVFNKTKVIGHLITNCNFRMQNHKPERISTKQNRLGIGLSDDQESFNGIILENGPSSIIISFSHWSHQV
jgi:hypothetical protein